MSLTMLFLCVELAPLTLALLGAISFYLLRRDDGSP